MPHPELILFFMFIAFVYASVGFGGGSSYLAILTLYGFPLADIKLTALVCNIIVVTGGTMIFNKNKQLNWRKVLPLVLVSVPMAYLGAQIKLSEDMFFVILGATLMVAALLLWIKSGAISILPAPYHTKQAVGDGLLGGAIGFLSGMVSIGGGIFLSPILNLRKWDTAHKVAATAGLFILVNSISGLAGQLSKPHDGIDVKVVLYFGLSVMVGGQIGSNLAIRKFNPLIIRRVTALVVLVAGMEALVKHLHFS
jgi:uncharacterized membrane protein YfcA